ncbi:hypothetical protein KR074_008629, partial [Drosophila pseudoananassae]
SHSDPRAGILRTLHPLQLQAECSGGGAFRHQTQDGGLGERIELAEVECDVDTIKKLKLGQRSSLWSRPSSTTSQLQQEHQQQQQQQQQQRQQQQPPHKRAHSKSPQPQQQQPLQQQRQQQHSPAPGQKLLSEKSDYSISV